MTNPPLNILQDPAARRAFTMHDRVWHNNRYVYPVVSRRSKGISIGVNLNPDKVCNFDCIYCSVDRTESATPNPSAEVDLARLADELRAMLAVVQSGEIFTADPFDKIPHELRRINDIAFSGDGEPTTFPEFPQVIQLAADIKNAAALPEVKLVLISNATMFHRPQVQNGLAILGANNGEIWAKLDAGTDDYYHLVDRTSVPFARVLQNILAAAQARPIVIQSLFMKVHGEAPSQAEFDAYIARVAHILTHGGKLKLTQLYTVARRTTEAFATALTESELNVLAARLRAALAQLPVEIYP